MRPTIDATIAERYVLVHALTGWGLGETWKARDTRFKDRLVAVKFLRPLDGARSALPAALEDHMKALRALRHAAVLGAVNHGCHEGRPFLAHDLFDGEPLGAMLDAARTSGEKLPLALLEQVFDGVCVALEAALDRPAPVVHGSLRPSCVLVRARDGKVDLRVMDFGIAPWAELPPAPPGSALGVACLAPEQFNGGAPTPATDVFATALLLLDALSEPRDGAAGYQGRDDVPDAVWDAILRATRVEPGERFASIGALREALQVAWKQPVTRDEAPVPAADEAPAPRVEPGLLHEEVGRSELPVASPLSVEAPVLVLPPLASPQEPVEGPYLKTLVAGAPGRPARPVPRPSITSRRSRMSAIDTMLTLVSANADPEKLAQTALALRPAPPPRLAQLAPAAPPVASTPLVAPAPPAPATPAAQGSSNTVILGVAIAAVFALAFYLLTR